MRSTTPVTGCGSKEHPYDIQVFFRWSTNQVGNQIFVRVYAGAGCGVDLTKLPQHHTISIPMGSIFDLNIYGSKKSYGAARCLTTGSCA
jgi:hypothetical protein